MLQLMDTEGNQPLGTSRPFSGKNSLGRIWKPNYKNGKLHTVLGVVSALLLTPALWHIYRKDSSFLKAFYTSDE